MEGERRKYIPLNDLEAYKLAREYGRLGWKIYQRLSWQIKKIMGDQMIESIDSVGGNIAEGYGRFHYLDKNKFYYNARGSLLESVYWIEVLSERGFVAEEEKQQAQYQYKQIEIKINNLISSQFSQKNKE